MNRGGALRVLAGAAAGTALARPASAAGTIRAIGLPFDSGLELRYAMDAGIVKAAGLDVQLQSLAYGAAIQSAIAGGAADVGITNVGSLAIAREKGLPLVAVASSALYTSSAPTSVLMVAKDSPLRTARDLNGKTVAVNGLNSISQFGPEAWIDKHGGDSKTVRWLDLPFAEMPSALSSHRIDAALVAEPAATLAKRVARVFANAYDAVAPRFLITVWFAKASWVSANPDLARRFAAAIYRGAAWCNAHQARTAETLTAVTHLNPAVARAMHRAQFAESGDPALLKPQIDVAYRYGALAKPIAPAELFAPELRG